MRNTLNSIDPIPQLGEKAEESERYVFQVYKVSYDMKPLPAIHVDNFRLPNWERDQSAWTSGAWMAGPQDETIPCPKGLEPMEKPAEACEGCRQFEAEQKAYIEKVTADQQRLELPCFALQWTVCHDDGSIEFWHGHPLV